MPTDTAATWLAGEFTRTDGSDTEGRAVVIHALSTLGKAQYEQANALNRVRRDLDDAPLAHLALTFANLDRLALAGEVVAKLEDGALGSEERLEAGPVSALEPE